MNTLASQTILWHTIHSFPTGTVILYVTSTERQSRLIWLSTWNAEEQTSVNNCKQALK